MLYMKIKGLYSFFMVLLLSVSKDEEVVELKGAALSFRQRPARHIALRSTPIMHLMMIKYQSIEQDCEHL